MVKLSTAELRQLVDVLITNPAMETRDGRRTALIMAGLEELSHRIKLDDGPTYDVVTDIVLRLASYGRVSRDHEALGLFLNEIKTRSGLEQQKVLSVLMTRHSMMVPVAESPLIDDWMGHSTPDQVKEKIIVSNTLRPIAFLSLALAAARSVALIEVRGEWLGTGFLVGPDLLMTNHHVLPNRELLSRTVVYFNYEDDHLGNPKVSKQYRLMDDFYANAKLDYAVVSLDGRPGDEWGWLGIERTPINIGERVNIIQHPGGRPKQIAMQSNFVEYVGGDVVQYVTATEHGSSGAPVLNDRWQVCAVHRAGGDLPEPTTGDRYYRNEGVLVGSVFADLPDHVLDRLAHIGRPG